MTTYSANGCNFIARDDMIVAWEKKTGQTFEPKTTEWMNGVMLERDGCYVDVGASTGWFVVPMAKVGYRVVAFEPNTNAFVRLRDNCDLNGVKPALNNVAASDKNGEAILFFNAGLMLTSGGSLNHSDCLCPTAQRRVETVKIDDAVKGQVALIKIDVEGHEIGVLNGALKTVAKHKPHLVLEANTPEHKAALVEWLERNGYTFEDADERNLLCSPVS